MSNIAYQERDIKAIERRSKINFIFKAMRKIERILFRYSKKQIKSVSTFPMIKNKEELIEIANK